MEVGKDVELTTSIPGSFRGIPVVVMESVRPVWETVRNRTVTRIVTGYVERDGPKKVGHLPREEGWRGRGPRTTTTDSLNRARLGVSGIGWLPVCRGGID